MNCIVVAGGRPGAEDPLYPLTQGKPKALLTLGEQPMLAYVLRALSDSRYVERLIVVGIEATEGEATLRYLSSPEQVHFLPDQGGIVNNARYGLEWLEANRLGTRELLVSTADIPLLTGGIVDAFVDQCRPFDQFAYYNVVTRETMEARFPHSNRTFVRLQEVQVAGGDLILAQTRLMYTNMQLWEALANARKHAWQLARIVGPRTLLKLLLRRLALAEVEQLASRMFAVPIRIVTSPYPELAMDADKPDQVALLRHYLTT